MRALGQAHQWSQKAKRIGRAWLSESNLRTSARCSRRWAVSRATFPSNGSPLVIHYY